MQKYKLVNDQPCRHPSCTLICVADKYSSLVIDSLHTYISLPPFITMVVDSGILDDWWKEKSASNFNQVLILKTLLFYYILFCFLNLQRAMSLHVFVPSF
jgi:hypothetical protein